MSVLLYGAGGQWQTRVEVSTNSFLPFNHHTATLEIEGPF
jgi:hypothetical protein